MKKEIPDTGRSRNKEKRQAQKEKLAEFYLFAFASLVLADKYVSKRETVWVKRFFQNEKLHSRYYERFESLVYDEGDYKREKFRLLLEQIRESLATNEKRRFIYNLAQMCKSKGPIQDVEYEQILYIADSIGIDETDADSMINSVFSINETFMLLAGFLALGFILYFTRVVIVPLVIAIFITMIIHEVEVFVGRYMTSEKIIGVNKLLAMILIFAVVLILILTALESAKQIAERLPHYQEKMVQLLQSLPFYQSTAGGLDWSNILKGLQEFPVARTLGGVFQSTLNILSNFFLIIVFTGFLSFSKLRFQGTAAEMAGKISGYIVVKTFVSFLTGITVYLLCLSFSIDFALFWLILAFLFNYIPSVGSTLATIPPILLSMLQLQDWSLILIFALAMIFAQFFYGNILEPKLMGDKLDVNPVALLLGLIFWGLLWGLPGMFLAAPLMALIRLLASYYNFSRKIESMLSA